MEYIWQKNWPDFTWDSYLLLKPLSDVRFNQGALSAQVRNWLGMDVQLYDQGQIKDCTYFLRLDLPFCNDFRGSDFDFIFEPGFELGFDLDFELDSDINLDLEFDLDSCPALVPFFEALLFSTILRRSLSALCSLFSLPGRSRTKSGTALSRVYPLTVSTGIF